MFKSENQTIMSNIKNKETELKSAIDFFDGTPNSARVPMQHMQLMQIRPIKDLKVL